MAQIDRLNNHLQDLYGDKWPGLTPGMAQLWREELRSFEQHIVTCAVTQWARKNTFKLPGIEDLVALAIEILDAQQLARSRQLASSRQGTAAGPDYGAVLDAAVDSGPYDRRRWARLHVEMFRKGVCAPGRYDEAAVLCETYAAEQPEDAAAWLEEATWWRGGGTTRPLIRDTAW